MLPKMRNRANLQEKTIDAVHVPLVVTGVICPRCGRGMKPTVENTNGNRKRLKCSLCAGRFVGIFDPATGKIKKISLPE